MNADKKALVLGAGGFIGNSMVSRLKADGYWVRAVDLKYPDFDVSKADEFLKLDLRSKTNMEIALTLNDSNFKFCEIYQFAADMGGAGYIFSGDNDAEIMQNSALINLNLLQTHVDLSPVDTVRQPKILFSSSACIYPAVNQQDPLNPNCLESSAYPAAPDSEYGWEKLFSERLYFAYNRNHGIPIAVARYHNIFGPKGTYEGGREKAPAAICRKIALAKESDTIEIWGDGNQTRSFLYIDECIEATRRLMAHSSFMGPVNVGSEEMVTINELAQITAKVAGKIISIKHTKGPLGVRGRNSENTLIREKLDWTYEQTLEAGIRKTYIWVLEQIANKENQ